MLNTFAKILPQNPVSPELPSEIKSIDEVSVIQWQGKFKQCSNRLNNIQKECTNSATYWSAFFENQMSTAKSNDGAIIDEYLKMIHSVKQITDKKLTDFDKKISSRIKDMKSYIDSTEKSFNKRKEKKIEIEKHDYFYRLLDAKMNAAIENEDALELSAKETTEYENLKKQLSRCRKELINIETQMVENFPAAMSMFNEFVDNIQDVIFYDLQEITETVQKSFESFEKESVDFAGSFPQLHDSWSFDLSSIKRSVNSSEIFSKQKLGLPHISTALASPANSSLISPASASLASPASSTPLASPYNSTPTIIRPPESKHKLDSAGMRSLNLKNGVRRSKTVLHRRTSSKTEKDNGLGISLPNKRMSGRSFSSFSLDMNSARDADDAGSISSSTSSVNEDDQQKYLEATYKQLSSSPQLSPLRQSSKRSSILSFDGGNTNRMSISMGNNRLHNWKKTYNRSPSIAEDDNYITECPVTTEFSKVNVKLKMKAKRNMLMSAQLFLNQDSYYQEATYNAQYDYRVLLERAQKGLKLNHFENEGKKQVLAKAQYEGNKYGCLSFEKGETLYVLGEKENGLIGKSVDGRVGVIPRDLVDLGE